MQNDIEKTADNLVRSEVLLNVSHMVSELAQLDDYADDLAPLMERDDYESAVYDEIHNADPSTLRDLLEYVDAPAWITHGEHAPTSKEALAHITRNECRNHDDWQDLADFLGIEPQTLEALEHWVVTDRLADDLEEQGEMIVRDFLGLTIWGRTTSGQAISCDGVMHDVARALKARVAAMG